MDSPKRNYSPPSLEIPDEFLQTAEDLEIEKSQDRFGLGVSSSGILNRNYRPFEETSTPTSQQPITHKNVPKKRFRSPENNGASDDSANQTRAKYAKTSTAQTSIVATHYNNIDEKGLDVRSKSRIFFMRNFNNWIKTMLINDYLRKIRESLTNRAPIRVLDMCCGKGGDLIKWQKANINHLICTDIADVSIEQCQSRYNLMQNRTMSQPIFTAEFIPCDNTTCRLRERYKDPSIELNLVSCQFAFHYCFESLKQAECMLKNAAECLKTGGYFIGTIPDTYDIMKRQRTAKSKTYGNDIYQISFLCDTEIPPLFGAKYNFRLEGVVDCPEFLVYFPMFTKLARKFGLELVMKSRFEDYFDKNINSTTKYLLEKMQSLETYRASSHNSQNPNEFAHVADRRSYSKIGTLSKSEWEAASIYLVFAFRKMKREWDSKGQPVFV